jgi:serine/alanine adding enzyme
MGIEILEPKYESDWNEYVQRNPCTSFYHQLSWKRTLEQAYGLKSFYLLARDSCKVVGILPLFLVKSPIFGHSLVSVPYAPYGSVCADDDQVARALVDAAKEITILQGGRYLELRHVNEYALNLFYKEHYLSFVLELSEDPDELWKRFRAEIRNRVRRAMKSGIEFRAGNEYLPDFYEAYAEHMRDLGTPVHSFGLFQNLMDECPEQVLIFVVRYQEKTIGGMFAASFKDTLNDIWVCTLKRYSEYAPNNLLHWNAMKIGCELGLKYFDFGRSSKGSGTAEFKRRWGAQPSHLRYYQWVSDGQESFDPLQSGLEESIFVKVWRWLPISLTKVLGPRIRKGVP